MEITESFYQLLALVLLILLSPLFFILYILVKLTSKGPFIFKQKRMGKDEKIFTIYKIRTMGENADKLKEKYMNLNEYKPPIFKISNDPRYTIIGKYLGKSCLDELPQLLNIVKGEMSFVGPRPLPISEAKSLPKKYQSRFRILPGMVPPGLWQILQF